MSIFFPIHNILRAFKIESPAIVHNITTEMKSVIHKKNHLVENILSTEKKKHTQHTNHKKRWYFRFLMDLLRYF